MNVTRIFRCREARKGRDCGRFLLQIDADGTITVRCPNCKKLHKVSQNSRGEIVCRAVPRFSDILGDKKNG